MGPLGTVIGTLLLGTATFAGLVAYKVYQAYQPSTGPRISPYPSPRNALLVVDIQEDLTGSSARAPFPYPESAAFISRVNAHIAAARDHGALVIHIGHEMPDKALVRLLAGDRTLIGTPGARQDARLDAQSPHYFTKQASDSFTNPALSAFLEKNQVDTLAVVGLDGVHCVYKTALGGHNRGYQVTILQDAVVTRAPKTQEELKAMYQAQGLGVAEGLAYWG